MKKILILIAFSILISPAFSQVAETHKPMSKWSYNCYFKRMQKPNRDERRMKKGVRILKHKYISSNQLYKVANIYVDDEQRLAYVKEAYPKVSDKENAIVVCDAFDKFSYSTILWEYIKEQNAMANISSSDMASYQEYLELKDRKKDKQKDEMINGDKEEVVKKDSVPVTENKEEVVKPEITTIETTEVEIIKPLPVYDSNIIFPDASTYKGNKACETCIGDKQFLAFANSVAQFKSDEEKAKICMEYVYKFCFSTSQVMKLGLLMDGENYRYVFFKTAYEKVYDRDNFLHVKQLLTIDKLINGINEIYVVPRTDKPYAVPIVEEETITKCAVTDQDYSKIKAEIQKEYSSTTRAEVAKRLIRDYKCLTSKQIKELLPMFSLEADKLEVAKYAYEFALDRNNYSVVRDFFTSQASKDKLTEYINSFGE
jgi:hypothetical protein